MTTYEFEPHRLLEWMGRNIDYANKDYGSRLRWNALVSPTLIEATLEELHRLRDNAMDRADSANSDDDMVKRARNYADRCRRAIGWVYAQRHIADIDAEAPVDAFNYSRGYARLSQAVGLHRSAMKASGLEPEEHDLALYAAFDKLSKECKEHQVLITNRKKER